MGPPSRMGSNPVPTDGRKPGRGDVLPPSLPPSLPTILVPSIDEDRRMDQGDPRRGMGGGDPDR